MLLQDNVYFALFDFEQSKPLQFISWLILDK